MCKCHFLDINNRNIWPETGSEGYLDRLIPRSTSGDIYGVILPDRDRRAVS